MLFAEYSTLFCTLTTKYILTEIFVRMIFLRRRTIGISQFENCVHVVPHPLMTVFSKFSPGK